MKRKLLKVTSHPWRKGRRFRCAGKRWEVRSYQECRDIAAAHGYAGIKVN